MNVIWDAIVPPADASPEEHMRWRTIIAVLVAVCVSYLPISFGMYARAADLDDIKIQILESRLFETRLKQCQALVLQNETTKQFYWQKLNELMKQYYELMERNYEVPDCEEIL